MRALVGSVFTVLLTLSACGSNREMADAATVYCDLLFSCDCEQEKYVDVAACINDLTTERDAYIAEVKATAEANGLVFDQGCVDQQTMVPADLTCDLEGQEEFDLCTFCALAHGAQPEGAPCTDYEVASDCANGLFCYEGVCIALCVPPVGAGESCAGDLTECAEGLYCDFLDSVTCKPTVGPGAACPTGGECSPGLECGTDAICHTLPEAGEPCTDFNACAEGLQCDVDSTCQPIRQAGESCDSSECAEGLVCDDGVCKPPPGAGEACPDFGPCAEGASCDYMTNLCTADPAEICFLGEEDEYF